MNRIKPESEVQKEIMLKVSETLGCRAFRNNVGAHYDGHGNFIRYGLMPGSSDLIGFKRVVIRPEDVGKSVAQFLSIEVKSARGKLSEEQSRWIDFINVSGGKAFQASSVEAITTLLDPRI